MPAIPCPPVLLSQRPAAGSYRSYLSQTYSFPLIVFVFVHHPTFSSKQQRKCQIVVPRDRLVMWALIQPSLPHSRICSMTATSSCF
ncbi:hypothetical protein VTI28DRAFT_5482 [Corynascus sepedonium]